MVFKWLVFKGLKTPVEKRRLPTRKAFTSEKGDTMLSADIAIELGDCGMGMPVIRSWQALKNQPPGTVLQASSSHP